ncbi:MAG: hypothetical protein AVDCRST_MAG76-221 [uncultured Acidimicrobiales bacterium]|uniref:Uncharacterized protein n=1 Tax=uncultured Acidimicrobiales bacterium TaxID=310071 RepID=A0A6J4H2D5_9ACTN|nr:MAG: hypothetical protein AVDCRST_MAG76-221 [uncultured Acidimicrobiales bacterium]
MALEESEKTVDGVRVGLDRMRQLISGPRLLTQVIGDAELGHDL